ncbi:DUF427 domain-containing protein [Mycolicibacillus parakoreensis]|uniref:DUF427 domain-containing protein n=1 Tax=Mycolicibacillus parakoreensis TaxID=1069221 RepID=A0ABY3TYE1_9MYCO|nr:DUF427 domain-containing protein [Mycolicibacillus parakoreensis]MCV7316497.1 DUF427 domain-containing protein [Mycolicibacillus parakoreensis]ULN52728.1 DUF427 domain-containing protein [Mycolicibacillus parakoreensis]HLR99072.1 DUF427 domain-containing protein [Mycolicibacillus parakoreensis]
MSDRPVLTPDARHPITIGATGRPVSVRVGGALLAASARALTLTEAGYPAVQYLPWADVDTRLLSRTDTTSYCPYKGDAGYVRVTTADGVTVEDVGWCYRHPHPAVAAIAGHLAFYPHKADITVGDPGDADAAGD